MIGVMIAVHSDDKGLILPPNIAPNELIIIPIFTKENKEKILKKAKEIKKKLNKYNSVLDEREDYSVGWKFNESELKGYPIRIEFGPKDLTKKQVVVVRRDTNEKKNVKITSLDKSIAKTLEDIQNNLFEKAKDLVEKNMVEVKDLQNLKKQIKNKKIVLAPYCNDPKCEEIIKYKTGGAKTLNRPLKQTVKGNCVNCNKKAKYLFYFGKSY
tara:strand:- start:161 stop:796 length:636 start_codon:yes stop_codon:yes gene_type:complete